MPIHPLLLSQGRNIHSHLLKTAIGLDSVYMNGSHEGCTWLMVNPVFSDLIEGEEEDKRVNSLPDFGAWGTGS